jgi:hypothetical protein
MQKCIKSLIELLQLVIFRILRSQWIFNSATNQVNSAVSWLEISNSAANQIDLILC